MRARHIPLSAVRQERPVPRLARLPFVTRWLGERDAEDRGNGVERCRL